MAKRKLQRFTEIGTFKNVKELEEGKPFKGNWGKDFFKNTNPIILENTFANFDPAAADISIARAIDFICFPISKNLSSILTKFNIGASPFTINGNATLATSKKALVISITGTANSLINLLN